MSEFDIEVNKLSEDFFELLEGKVIDEHINKIKKEKKVTIEILKELLDLGDTHYQRYHLKEAEIIYLAYTCLCPFDHRGPASLASIYLEQAQFQKALEMLNIVKTYPTADFDETLVNITLCHYKLKEYIEAAAVFLIIKSENLNDFNQNRYGFLRKQLNPYLC
ncbi:regulator [Vibrio parahaemolyticus]|uniref:tetratricopeptide repeat protein n=1 Tax=Vibrio parahaemolyticus TaxID=670 RepID=UPI00084B41C0|nr:regulator [Vibrio parahaemolyticus]EID0733671.1 regulator [Vibrio parahaemolyticus]ELA9417304.1 regulator [Vibrio parahaemolyticus]ODY13061.1 regulator [Vibrio parahaemolyticus]